MFDMLIQALTQQISQPKSDIDKNIRALLSEWINKMQLVTSDELAHYIQQLQQAEQRIAELEKKLADKQQP